MESNINWGNIFRNGGINEPTYGVYGGRYHGDRRYVTEPVNAIDGMYMNHDKGFDGNDPHGDYVADRRLVESLDDAYMSSGDSPLASTPFLDWGYVSVSRVISLIRMNAYETKYNMPEEQRYKSPAAKWDTYRNGSEPASD